MTKILHPSSKQSDHHRWPEGAIVYQIYPRSFNDSNHDGIGDIPGIIQKLDYLKGLGINAIWLSPFYPSPMADFGYDVADYCDVDPIFGELEDILELIAQAHKLHIKIMVDLVPNHTSDEHEWFRQSRQSREDVYSDWYIWKDPKGHDKDGKPIPPNNWISVLTGDSAWEWEPARQQFYLHSFDVRQPDLNWANTEVHEAIKSAMRFWLDKGVDGFRVDAVPFMAKDPLFRDEPLNPDYKPDKGHWKYSALIHTYSSAQPHLYAYLSDIASVLKEKKYAHSERFMVVEAYPNTDSPIEEYLEFYEGMDPDVAAPFNFAGFSLAWDAAAWRDYLATFHTALADLSPKCIASYAFGNHDQYRMVSRLGKSAARSAAVLLLTLPGMSFVYNGDELGMENVKIPPDMVQDPQFAGGFGRDPVRTPMQWSADKNAGFSTAHRTWLPVATDFKQRNVAVQSKDPSSFLSLYRQLSTLRNSSPALRYGAFQVFETGNKDILGFVRNADNDNGAEHYLTLINFSAKQCKMHLPDNYDLGTFVLSSDPRTELNNRHSTENSLLPYEAVVFRQEVS